MAQTAVNILIEQLAALIIQEATLLSGAKAGVAAIQRDLETIRAFLHDADQQQHTNEGVKVWVKQVRETAYGIEDAVDEFFYRMRQPSGPGLAGFLHKSTRLFRELSARHWVANKVQDFHNRLQQISATKNKFSFAVTGSSGATANFDHVPRLAALFVEESQVVGIDKPREKLIERLLAQKWKYGVVSVAGMGGLGKTTLVRKVYEDLRVKKHFVSHAWVTVSQTFVPEDLLKSMIKQLQVMKETPAEDLSGMAYVQLVETLRAYLGEKRYVIVLDDVWSVDAWEVIKCAFPENKCGSRIMVTTRIANVATYCSKHNDNVHMLEPLPEKEAWNLFCRKVFGAEAGNGCPTELKPTASNILQVCGGLPLAIVAIGGILSTRRQALTEWETIYQSIRSEIETNDSLQQMKKILWLSYDNLPHHLKPCFLYFGVFPEDYSVKRAKLTRLWIAEGFIKPRDNKSLEKIAEDYLGELVQRSLVQAPKLDYFGRVHKCRVHDLMYELILLASKEQNFHLCLTRGSSELPDNVRRFVANSGQSLPQSSNFTHLRSLLLLGANRIPLLFPFRVLKVLHLKGVHMELFPLEILDLFHLRYLHLRKTSISILPKGIGKLRNLQTLDLKCAPISSVPNEILKLKNLRHLLIYEQIYLGVEMPEKLGKLTSLQKLAHVNITGGAEQLKELGKLTQLKRLGITKVSSSDGEALCASINNMCQLQSLYLFPGIDQELLKIEKLSVNSPFLRSINLRGKLRIFPEFILSLKCLEKLRLNFSKMTTDPFGVLQNLPSLIELNLHNDAYEGEELHSESQGFQKLKKLYIDKFGVLRRLVMDQGAMPNLEYLEVLNCENLERVPTGIEHLTNLKEFYLGLVSEECMNRVRRNEGKDWNKVKHIPIVRKVYQENGRLYHKDL